MWKDEKHYHFCNWIIDRWLDEWEAKMHFDCPDSYQLRGMKEEQESPKGPEKFHISSEFTRTYNGSHKINQRIVLYNLDYAIQ